MDRIHEVHFNEWEISWTIYKSVERHSKIKWLRSLAIYDLKYNLTCLKLLNEKKSNNDISSNEAR